MRKLLAQNKVDILLIIYLILLIYTRYDKITLAILPMIADTGLPTQG